MTEKRPFQADEKHYEPLGFVTTVTEAADTWCYNRSTIQRAIDAGFVAAVKSGRIWLVSVPSIVAYFGYPPALSECDPMPNGPGTALQILRGGGQKCESGAV